MDPSSARNRQSKQIKFMQKRKKNTVSFNYDIKLARMPDKQDEMALVKNIFAKKSKNKSVKDLAYVYHVPEQPSCARNEYYTTVQAGQTAYI